MFTLTVVQGPMYDLSESIGIHWYFLVWSVPSRALQSRYRPVSIEARFHLYPLPPYRCFLCVSSKVSSLPNLDRLITSSPLSPPGGGTGSTGMLG
jgi:hypothetical protein